MLDWLVDMYNGMIDFLYACLLTLFDILKDFFFWVFDQLMTLVVLLLDGVATAIGGLDISVYLTALPPETIYFLGVSGLGEAMGMITSCIVVRFLLQTIPLVRWGS